MWSACRLELIKGSVADGTLHDQALASARSELEDGDFGNFYVL